MRFSVKGARFPCPFNLTNEGEELYSPRGEFKRIFILPLIVLLIFCNCGKRERRILNKDLPSEQGTWNVYFSKSVKNPESANGDVELGPKLINRIDQARYYIDASFYQQSLPEVAGALISAKERGLSIRFSTENENANEYQVTRHSGISKK